MLAILKRELRSYFFTPIAYVFLAVLYIFFGMFFLMNNVMARGGMMGPEAISGDFAPIFSTMILIVLFIIPILTMKLISEERRQKTDQLLHTVPTSTFEIVIAKYLSAMCVFILGLIISIIYPLLIHFMGGANIKLLGAAYMGFLLIGGAFIAICVFASAITESQFIAAIVGFFIILGMWLMEFISQFFKIELIKGILDLFSIVSRFGDFQAGIIKVSGVVYYLSIIIIFLFLTMRVIDKRRWTEG